MWYIAALGNTGEAYVHTRHNSGWLVADEFRSLLHVPDSSTDTYRQARIMEGSYDITQLTFIYPETLMNLSGVAIKNIVPPSALAHLIVVHDDINLPFGQLRVSVGGGAGGHNGVASVITSLQSKEFVRLRIGIAPVSIWTGKPRRPQGGGSLERFVLQPFSRREQQALPALCGKAVEALKLLVTAGPERAMNAIN